MFKVTFSITVRANNPRHAAHIVKGLIESGKANLDHCEVEELRPVSTYKIDLSKKEGERGYCVEV